MKLITGTREQDGQARITVLDWSTGRETPLMPHPLFRYRLDWFAYPTVVAAAMLLTVTGQREACGYSPMFAEAYVSEFDQYGFSIWSDEIVNWLAVTFKGVQ